MIDSTKDPRDGLHKNSGRMTVEGVKFESWRVGILRSKWVSVDGRIELTSAGRLGSLWGCRLDGKYILADGGYVKHFRSQKTATRAALKAIKAGS